METTTTFLKENFDLILLFIGFLGVVISFISLFYEIKKRKRQKEKDKDS